MSGDKKSENFLFRFFGVTSLEGCKYDIDIKVDLSKFADSYSNGHIRSIRSSENCYEETRFRMFEGEIVNEIVVKKKTVSIDSVYDILLYLNWRHDETATTFKNVILSSIVLATMAVQYLLLSSVMGGGHNIIDESEPDYLSCVIVAMYPLYTLSNLCWTTKKTLYWIVTKFAGIFSSRFAVGSLPKYTYTCLSVSDKVILLKANNQVTVAETLIAKKFVFTDNQLSRERENLITTAKLQSTSNSLCQPDDIAVSATGRPDDIAVSATGRPDDIAVSATGRPDDIAVSATGHPLLSAIPKCCDLLNSTLSTLSENISNPPTVGSTIILSNFIRRGLYYLLPQEICKVRKMVTASKLILDLINDKHKIVIAVKLLIAASVIVAHHFRKVCPDVLSSAESVSRLADSINIFDSHFSKQQIIQKRKMKRDVEESKCQPTITYFGERNVKHMTTVMEKIVCEKFKSPPIVVPKPENYQKIQSVLTTLSSINFDCHINRINLIRLELLRDLSEEDLSKVDKLVTASKLIFDPTLGRHNVVVTKLLFAANVIVARKFGCVLLPDVLTRLNSVSELADSIIYFESISEQRIEEEGNIVEESTKSHLKIKGNFKFKKDFFAEVNMEQMTSSVMNSVTTEMCDVLPAVDLFPKQDQKIERVLTTLPKDLSSINFDCHINRINLIRLELLQRLSEEDLSKVDKLVTASKLIHDGDHIVAMKFLIAANGIVANRLQIAILPNKELRTETAANFNANFVRVAEKIIEVESIVTDDQQQIIEKEVMLAVLLAEATLQLTMNFSEANDYISNVINEVLIFQYEQSIQGIRTPLSVDHKVIRSILKTLPEDLCIKFECVINRFSLIRLGLHCLSEVELSKVAKLVTASELMHKTDHTLSTNFLLAANVIVALKHSLYCQGRQLIETKSQKSCLLFLKTLIPFFVSVSDLALALLALRVSMKIISNEDTFVDRLVNLFCINFVLDFDENMAKFLHLKVCLKIFPEFDTELVDKKAAAYARARIRIMKSGKALCGLIMYTIFLSAGLAYFFNIWYVGVAGFFFSILVGIIGCRL